MTNPFPYPQPSTAPAPGMEALLEPVAGVALAGDCREPGRLLWEVGRGQAEVPRGFWFNGRVELKRMFGVDKGDTVKLSVKAYYENDPATDAMLSAAEMLAQILMGAEGGPAAGEGASVSNSTLDESAVAAMNANKSASAQEDVPKAFLNYMFFDEDMTFVTSGFVQITGAAKNLWENMAFANPIVIEENGYFLTYVSNETNAASVVDFDDLTVTHSKTPIVQVDDYYPFGLTFNSFTRSYSELQKYKYNGKEEQEDWGVGVLDYGARMYMADIGRFGTQDRFTVKYYDLSPYQYTANNPIRYVDVNGDSIRVNNVTYIPGQEYKGDDKFVGQVFTALNYLLDKDADVTGVINFLAGDDEDDIDIIENKGESLFDQKNAAYYDSGTDEDGNRIKEDYIKWDATRGARFDEYSHMIPQWIMGGEGKRSPAELLLHELGHKKSFRENPEKHIKDRKTRFAGYDNVEEFEVIKNVENPAAKQLNHMKRTYHGGTFYKVKSPTSTEEQ